MDLDIDAELMAVLGLGIDKHLETVEKQSPAICFPDAFAVIKRADTKSLVNKALSENFNVDLPSRRITDRVHTIVYRVVSDFVSRIVEKTVTNHQTVTNHAHSSRLCDVGGEVESVLHEYFE